MDGLINCEPSKSEALKVAHETENMLAKGSFTVKCWQFSQGSGARTAIELCVKNDKVTKPSGSVYMHTDMFKGTGDNLSAGCWLGSVARYCVV